MSKKKTGTDIFPEMTFIHYGDKDPTPEDIVAVYQKPWQNHVEYIIGDNAWKNYLIPGYAGYRGAIRNRLME